MTLAALVLTSMFGLAAPAGANHYEVRWDAPDSGAVVSGTSEITATIWSLTEDLNGKVRRWTLDVLDAAGETTGTLCSEDYTGALKNEPVASLDWDTRFYAAGEPSAGCDSSPKPSVPGTLENLSRNGEHTLRIWVETVLLHPLTGNVVKTETETFTRQVTLNNAALAPTGVAAAFNAATQLVTVSWNPSPEPDVTGYAVDVCTKAGASEPCSAGEWSRVANPTGRTTTTVSLAAGKAGSYRYRVAAARPDATGSSILSAATQTDPLGLGTADEDGATPTTVSAGGEDTAGSGPNGSGDESSTAGAGAGGGKGSGGSGGSDERSRNGLPPRLVERTEVDAGYEEALPYGAKPLEKTGGGPLDVATEGVGLALVPIAGGLALFVFAMQMRYLSRRAAAVAALGAGPSVSVAIPDEDDAPVPLFRLGAGGSFISNWKRLLED